jgi:hypothetical protein
MRCLYDASTREMRGGPDKVEFSHRLAPERTSARTSNVVPELVQDHASGASYAKSGLGQSRHFNRAPITSGLPR